MTHWVVLEDCHKQDATWAFDTVLISKVEATMIHLSFNAVSWRGEAGLGVRNLSPTRKANVSTFEAVTTKGLGC